MIRPGKLGVIAAMLALLSACGEKAASVPAAMKVNGEPISIEEVEIKLRQYANLPPDQKQSVTNTILTSLTDSELLRQGALREHLDTDAAVKARLAGVSRLILANAYIEKTIAAVKKPSEAEIKTYFDQHPDRFSQRKNYDLQELVILGAPAILTEVDAKAAGIKEESDLTPWLIQQKIPHNDQRLLVTSEKILEPVLEKLRATRGGEVIRLMDKDKMTILFVNKVEAQPLTLPQASGMIANQLFEERKGEAMKNIVKSLREKAKIEYLPPYTMKGAAAAPL